MTPSFSIERRQAAEVVSWIRDRIPEQKGNAWERGSQRKEREEISSLSSSSTSGAFPARDVPRRLSPFMIFLLPPHRPSLSATLSARPSMAKITRARKMMAFMRAHARTHTENVCARASDLRSYSLSLFSLNHLGCYIYKDIFIDLIIKECGEWVERKSEDVFFFSFFRQNQERISLARAPEKRGGKSLEDRDGKNSSSTGVKSLLTCNEVLARIVKSRWLVSGACGRFP